MLGGCTGVQEDEPMPMGATIPKTVKTAEAETTETPEVTPPVAEPQTVTEKTENQTPEDPVIVEPATKKVEEAKPAPAPVVKEKGTTPQKGDTAKVQKPVRENDVEYIVKSGDSYWKIAREFGIATADLVAYNNIPPQKLRAGQKIMIPATGKKITAKKAVEKKSVVKVQKTYAPIPADGIHVVKKGDSFYKIALKYGLNAKDIAEYNNLPMTKMLQVNQKLKLPPAKKATVTADKKVTPATTDVTPVDNTVPAPTPVTPAANTLDEIAPPSLEVEAPATTNTNAPAANNATAPATENNAAVTTSSEIMSQDITLSELAKAYGFTEAEIRAKNPGIPADGNIKSGTTIYFP